MRDNIKEYEAVAKAAENFVRSVAEGDSRYAKKLFTEDAVLFGILDGVLEHGSIEQFYHNVDTVGAGDNFKARITRTPTQSRNETIFDNRFSHSDASDGIV